MAWCLHKTQYAQHGLECQMSNCRMTKLQTLLPMCLGQVCPTCQDFPPISTLALSVYPSSCRMERGAEHTMGLLYDTVRQEQGEDGAGFCHWQHKHQEALTPGGIDLLQRYFSPAKNYITLSVLATSSKRQGKNPHCQASVNLPDPDCFYFALYPLHHWQRISSIQQLSKEGCIRHQSWSVHDSSSSRRLSPRGGEHTQVAHVNTDGTINAYIRQQGLNWNCLLSFKSHHLPCWVWWSYPVVVCTYFMKTDLNHLLGSTD